MKKLFALSFVLFFAIFGKAQNVAINNDGSNADSPSPPTPGGAGGRVDQLDARGGQLVADAVGRGEVLGGSRRSAIGSAQSRAVIRTEQYRCGSDHQPQTGHALPQDFC